MERLGIFVFYDREGIVDSYIDYLLCDLRKCLSYLIIVVNGKVDILGYDIFSKYADQIVIRNNKGFDIGAYKEIIEDLHQKKEMRKWDEIVFCNDTFYGPFIPFTQIFDEMAQRQVDFWGLNYIDNSFLSHIQSYFLVFGKKILEKGDLLAYMNCIDSDIKDLSEIYAVFEVGIFSYLKNRGYSYGTYIFTENYSIYEYSHICVKRFHFPVLKKRCFSLQYYKEENLGMLLQFLQMEKGYDINLILESVYRLYGVKVKIAEQFDYNSMINLSEVKKIPSCIDERTLLNFIRAHPKIYIYGTGIFAKHIWFQFHKYFKQFKGFIISDNQKVEKRILYNYPVMHYKNAKDGKAIIVAVGLKNLREIRQGLKDKDEILVLWKEK